MKTILKYPGAKNRIAKWIVQHIPEHKVYCEPFLGSGAIFFNKQPCYNEILNDLDDEVFIFLKDIVIGRKCIYGYEVVRRKKKHFRVRMKKWGEDTV